MVKSNPVVDCACVMVCSRCTLLQGPSVVWWNIETNEAVGVNCPQIRCSTPPHVSPCGPVGLGKHVALGRLSLWDLYLIHVDHRFFHTPYRADFLTLGMLSGSCFAIHID